MAGHPYHACLVFDCSVPACNAFRAMMLRKGPKLEDVPKAFWPMIVPAIWLQRHRFTAESSPDMDKDSLVYKICHLGDIAFDVDAFKTITDNALLCLQRMLDAKVRGPYILDAPLPILSTIAYSASMQRQQTLFMTEIAPLYQIVAPHADQLLLLLNGTGTVERFIATLAMPEAEIELDLTASAEDVATQICAATARIPWHTMKPVCSILHADFQTPWSQELVRLLSAGKSACLANKTILRMFAWWRPKRQRDDDDDDDAPPAKKPALADA